MSTTYTITGIDAHGNRTVETITLADPPPDAKPVAFRHIAFTNHYIGALAWWTCDTAKAAAWWSRWWHQRTRVCRRAARLRAKRAARRSKT